MIIFLVSTPSLLSVIWFLRVILAIRLPGGKTSCLGNLARVNGPFDAGMRSVPMAAMLFQVHTLFVLSLRKTVDNFHLLCNVTICSICKGAVEMPDGWSQEVGRIEEW